MNEIKELLKGEIQDEMDALGTTQVGTDEYKTTVDGLTKLVDRIVEMEKLENEKAKEEANTELRAIQIEQEHKDNKIRNWLTGLGLGSSTLLAIWGTLKTFKFEETGTVTSLIGRAHINKLLKK